MDNISWDQYFMSMAYLAAMKSKDPSTHIGAIVVGPDNEIRSTGFNGLCRGVKDDVPERNDRPEKYFWYEHGERNAAFNSARMGGAGTAGCRMYTQGVPCADCARCVIQSGISEVIVDVNWDKDQDRAKWIESCSRSLSMFEEAKVKVRYYEGPLISEITGLRNGKVLHF